MTSANTTCESSEYLIKPHELDQRITESGDLIMLPTVATEALELANDPDCSIPKFVSVIETDPSLVTDILSISNSSAYGARNEIKSIHQAVVHIGTTQCKNLIISSCVRSLSRNLPPSVAWSRDVLWKHNTQAAAIARELNRAFGLGFAGEEFSGAMLHDIGRFILAAAAPDVFDVVDRMSFCESVATIENERALIGTDHCEIGANFAQASKLPKSLTDVIRFHHNPSESEEYSLLVHLVASADHLANHIMHAGETEPYDPELSPSFQVITEAGKSVDIAAVIRRATAAGIESGENAGSLDS
ncbi:MAG: HDOD domain-containing protein [Planctomycetales bacterium]|nr:HDOD domain-containing protein [Planctomycetales bacterium]